MHWTIFFVCFFLVSSAHALPLTWEECLKFTIEGNPQLETAKNEWLATQTSERVALAGYLPRLNASTSVTQVGSSGQNGGTGPVVSNGVILNSTGSSINTNYLAQLNFSQNIFNGLEDQSRLDQAKWRTESSFWVYVDTKSSLSFSLKEAFASLMFAQESVELAQSILERRESNFKLVSVRFENGRENKGSVLLAEAYFEQAGLDVIKARDGLNVAQSKLKSLMNKDHVGAIEVTGTVPLEELQFKKDIPELALETPAYNQAMAYEMAAKEDITIARSTFLPSLDFTGNVFRQGPSYFPERERWQMALTLTIPLFDGLKDRGALQGSVLSKYAAEGKKRSTLLDLIPRLRDAQNLAKQSDLKYSIDGKFQKASGTRAEIARAKYNNGLITFEDWDIIENELIQRQTNFLQSKKDRVVKYATWENLLGSGVIP